MPLPFSRGHGSRPQQCVVGQCCQHCWYAQCIPACHRCFSVGDPTHGQPNTARDTVDVHSRLASAPGHNNQWPGSASIALGMHSPSQPAEHAFGVGTDTHGQPNTARDTVDVHSLPALAPGHSNLWPGSETTTAGMNSPSQPCASSSASGSNLTHGQPTAAHDTAAKLSHAAAQAPGHSTLRPASVSTTGGAHSASQPVAIPAIVQRWQG